MVDGLCDIEGRALSSVELKYTYPLYDENDDGNLNLTLATGTANVRTGELTKDSETGGPFKSVALAAVNYHRDCKSYPTSSEVESYLSRASTDWQDCQKVLRTIFTDGS